MSGDGAESEGLRGTPGQGVRGSAWRGGCRAGSVEWTVRGAQKGLPGSLEAGTRKK